MTSRNDGGPAFPGDELLVPVRQYLLPDGRTRDEYWPATGESIYSQAMQFIDMGGRFEAEVLRTGHVSVTGCLDDEEVAIAIVPNGPQVNTAMERVVADAMLKAREGGAS